MAAVFATWVKPEPRHRIEEGRLLNGFGEKIGEKASPMRAAMRDRATILLHDS